MRSFIKINLTALMVLNLVACAFVPKVEHSQTYAKNCEMYTKEFTLDAISLGGLDCGGNTSCVAVAGLIPITTFLVSGSIVLVGNTVHWLEYQGSCDEGLVQSGINKFIPEDEIKTDAQTQAEEKPLILLDDVSFDPSLVDEAKGTADTSSELTGAEEVEEVEQVEQQESQP